MMDQSRLEKVLPYCVYSPTYIVRDFPIARYQGLQFVSSADTPYKLDLFDICLALLMNITDFQSLLQSANIAPHWT